MRRGEMSLTDNIQDYGIERFPLLPYSQLVFDMMKTEPDIYQMVSRYIVRRENVDAKRLKNAFITALKAHQIFSMEIDQDGMHYLTNREDILHGQYHSVDIQTTDTEIIIDVSINRILTDAISGMVAAQDVFRSYFGQPIKEDKYIEFLRQVEEYKHSEQCAINKQWLEEEFADGSVPVHPTLDLPIDTEVTPIAGFVIDDFTDLLPALETMQLQYLVTHTAFFSLCAALAIMDYNNTNQAALTWAYDGRETEEEEHICGSLHRDVPFKIVRDKYMPVEEQKHQLLKQARKQTREGIRHSAYPYTLLPPQNNRWNYAVNVLQQPILDELMRQLPFSVEMTEMTPDPPIAYALMDIEIYLSEQLLIGYRYSATHYQPQSIERFRKLMRHYAKILLTK